MLRLLATIMFLLGITVLSSSNSNAQTYNDTLLVVSVEPGSVIIPADTIIVKGKTKGEAILWWALGGVVGLHRIYLGTSPVIPVFYAVTLGGGMGLLVLGDLIAILIVKDINDYADNPSILMWVTEKSKKQPSAD